MQTEFSATGVARFWSYVRKTDGCWFWTRGLSPGGYGKFRLDYGHWRAHRLAWTLTHGPISPGLYVCHSCDANYPPGDRTYRACVNPAHLYLEDHDANMARMEATGRVAIGARHSSRTHPERVARGLRNGAHTHPERRPTGSRNARFTHPEQTARGERNGFSRLDEATVRAIRQLAEEGMPYKRIAPRFGISDVHVGNIVSRRAWAHVV